MPLRRHGGWGTFSPCFQSLPVVKVEMMSQQNPFGGTIIHLTPAQVREGMEKGEILLVDVREADEIRAAHIPGAVAAPLTTFDPHALPAPEGRRIVFSCRSGQRSQKAAAAAQAAGLALEEHMAGGIIAWNDAGFPVEQG